MGLQANTSGDQAPHHGPNAKFVLLRHECQNSHWDLMIAIPGEERLWTWQVHTAPETWDETLAAKRIADHRLIYLTYQGEISGGRGHVTRVDAGGAVVLALEPHVRVRLEGKLVKGDFTIVSPTSEGGLI